ncbi:hypothetical protein [Noviherbaspirillum pedocola]|uniref:Uncharacterized protein n=1 Tax=Noviherbaspirillum pedocola TaxID=2801341 RepID=A0A934SVW3_9BURK|nr:hypothetical protein [Noviherbaspirillum pedocola]MBK4736101.1 hypothetical protein [Noviherbaspirillum pedocola]
MDPTIVPIALAFSVFVGGVFLARAVNGHQRIGSLFVMIAMVVQFASLLLGWDIGSAACCVMGIGTAFALALAKRRWMNGRARLRKLSAPRPR